MKRLELLRLAKHYHLKVACLPIPPHPRKIIGLSGVNRTPNILLRRQSFYPIEIRREEIWQQMKDFHPHDGIALPIKSLGLLSRLIFKHPFYDLSLQGIQTPFDSLQSIMLYTGRTHTTQSTRHFLFRQSTILKYLKFTFTARNFKRSGFGFPKDNLEGFSEFSISCS